MAKCNLGEVKIKPMLVSGGQGFMRPEVTYGVSQIARVLRSSRVRLCSLRRASNRAFVLPFITFIPACPAQGLWLKACC